MRRGRGGIGRKVLRAMGLFLALLSKTWTIKGMEMIGISPKCLGKIQWRDIRDSSNLVGCREVEGKLRAGMEWSQNKGCREAAGPQKALGSTGTEVCYSFLGRALRETRSPQEGVASERKPQTHTERLLCSSLVQKSRGILCPGESWKWRRTAPRPWCGAFGGNQVCGDCCLGTNQGPEALIRSLIHQWDRSQLPRPCSKSWHDTIHWNLASIPEKGNGNPRIDRVSISFTLGV